MEIVTEENIAKLQKLVKLGASSQSNIKDTMSFSKSQAPVLQLLSLQTDTVTLSHTGYAVLGLARLFAHKCSRFLELLNRKWKVMIGWVLTKQDAPNLGKLNETINESELTLIERILDGEVFEDLSGALSVGGSVGTLVNTVVASSPDKELFNSMETSGDSSQDSLQELSFPDQILPKLGLSLSSGLSEKRNFLPENLDSLEVPARFDPSDCLDKLSLSLLENTHDIGSLNSSQLPFFDLNVMHSNEKGRASEPFHEESRNFTVADSAGQNYSDPEPKERTVLDAIFTGMGQSENEPDELEPRAIFQESQTGLMILSAQRNILDKDLALQQPTPQALARPIQLPKSLLNLPEGSFELSESDLSLTCDSTPHLVEICDEEYDEEIYGAYKRRNQQKSRYDIRIHLDPERPRGQDELATKLFDSSATKKLLRRPVKLAKNFQNLKIPAWSELLEGSDLLSHFHQTPADGRSRHRRPFEPIATSSVGSWIEKVAEDEVNLSPIESMRDRGIPEDLSIDDVARDAMEDYNSELSELSLIRPPPAVGRENAEGELQYGLYETMENLPYDESELLFYSDNDSHETSQLQTKFEQWLISWLQERGGRDTLQNIIISMPREKEFEDFELGDIVHELISLKSTRAQIQQDVKQASEPIYITFC